MIPFLKFRWVYYGISTAVIVAGLLSIFVWKYNFSIDFIGGTNLLYAIDKNLESPQVKQILRNNDVVIKELRVENRQIHLKAEVIDEKKEAKIKQDLHTIFKTKVTVIKSETVGPTIGQEAIRKTIIASIIAIIGILLYLTFAFKNITFAVAAIVALLHDFLVVIGSYSLLNKFFGAEFDTLFVTALLTTMSFSVHDTIIIFDKIREHKKTHGISNIESLANRALTETIVRSFNNSMTIIFMLTSLLLLGGDTIRFFVAALLIGTLTGTYSSPFIATPILVLLEKLKKK